MANRRPHGALALLIVAFQLRLVGRSRLLHAMFRAESILNTPLFAGFPGFRTKLWVSDAESGTYRGIRRDDFLRDPNVVGDLGSAPAEQWWQLQAGVRV